ncbi:MAG: GrpB family protein [Alphaproteobacteria bacterium]|nr:GrpB family protein [Alphaproteobacteria bacterium]MBV9903889.1 GrpB family protein [Alphaproteobacteria bacterium]
MPGPVIIVDYDPRWPEVFEQLRAPLAAALGDVAQTIQHVGSTSVPGLAAKPIIDIDVLLMSADKLPLAIERLVPLGYRHEGDLGVPDREAFDRPPHLPYHHLYMCPPHSAEYRRHVAFRDFLRAHPEEANAYGALKRELAVQYRNDREGYSIAKTDFVTGILKRALS